jgi:hypothetical protein
MTFDLNFDSHFLKDALKESRKNLSRLLKDEINKAFMTGSGYGVRINNA